MKCFCKYTQFTFCKNTLQVMSATVRAKYIYFLLNITVYLTHIQSLEDQNSKAQHFSQEVSLFCYKRGYKYLLVLLSTI